jgi:hypothetical protein
MQFRKIDPWMAWNSSLMTMSSMQPMMPSKLLSASLLLKASCTNQGRNFINSCRDSNPRSSAF